jgi:hypothetical protein
MNVKTLLVVSLLLNVGLGIYAFRKPPTGEAAPAPAASAGHSPSKSEETATRQAITPPPSTNAVVKQFNWESVESPDYKQYIVNLRSIGCPEETIRDIIVADVTKLYDEKKKVARGEPKKFEFWKGGNPFFGAAGDSKSMEKAQALDEEKNNVLRALGIEPDFKTQAAQMISPFEAMFDFLPEPKRVQMLKAMTDMQSKMVKATEGGGQPDPAQMAKVQKEMELSIKQMLTPEEALNFDLRMSLTANLMRNQISGFDPNEQEFLKVFQLRKPFDDEFNPILRGDETEQERKRRETAEKQLNEQIKETLGPARYADYERAQDYSYQQIHRSAKAADLGTSEANQVYEMKKLVEEQTRKISSDRNLTPAQRNATLNEIRQETEKSLRGVLGEKGWEHYNRPMNTHWLKGFTPGPPQPVAAPIEERK